MKQRGENKPLKKKVIAVGFFLIHCNDSKKITPLIMQWFMRHENVFFSFSVCVCINNDTLWFKWIFLQKKCYYMYLHSHFFISCILDHRKFKMKGLPCCITCNTARYHFVFVLINCSVYDNIYLKYEYLFNFLAFYINTKTI